MNYTSFELANQNLNSIFKYPYPENMDACPCGCISEKDKQDIKEYKNLGFYCHKATTAWGNEKDFKHFIPELFHQTFFTFEVPCETFLNKLPYGIESSEELNAIRVWFEAYIHEKCINIWESLISSRKKAAHWLENRSAELCCELSFCLFSVQNIIELYQSTFFSNDLPNLSLCLDQWPSNKLDFIVLASCLRDDSISSIMKGFEEIYPEKVKEWYLFSAKRLEALFFETSDSDLQQLFSNSHLEIIDRYYYLSLFKS